MTRQDRGQGQMDGARMLLGGPLAGSTRAFLPAPGLPVPLAVW